MATGNWKVGRRTQYKATDIKCSRTPTSLTPLQSMSAWRPSCSETGILEHPVLVFSRGSPIRRTTSCAPGLLGEITSVYRCHWCLGTQIADGRGLGVISGLSGILSELNEVGTRYEARSTTQVHTAKASLPRQVKGLRKSPRLSAFLGASSPNPSFRKRRFID